MGNGQLYAMEMIPSGWAIIADPEQAELHGIACIKGRWASSKKESWNYNRPVYVPVAHIKTITVFDSLDDYFEAGRRARLAEFPKGEGPG